MAAMVEVSVSYAYGSSSVMTLLCQWAGISQGDTVCAKIISDGGVKHIEVREAWCAWKVTHDQRKSIEALNQQAHVLISDRVGPEVLVDVARVLRTNPDLHGTIVFRAEDAILQGGEVILVGEFDPNDPNLQRLREAGIPVYELGNLPPAELLPRLEEQVRDINALPIVDPAVPDGIINPAIPVGGVNPPDLEVHLPHLNRITLPPISARIADLPGEIVIPFEGQYLRINRLDSGEFQVNVEDINP